MAEVSSAATQAPQAMAAAAMWPAVFCHGCVTAALQCTGVEAAKTAALNMILPDVELHITVQALPQAVLAGAQHTVWAAVAMASPRYSLLDACARCSPSLDQTPSALSGSQDQARIALPAITHAWNVPGEVRDLIRHSCPMVACWTVELIIFLGGKMTLLRNV